MNRILFFTHYHKYNSLTDHIIYLLEHIKHLYNKIVFISNSLLDEHQKAKLAGLCSSIIIRENKGFDFGAWKDALLEEGWDNLTSYDNVTLMNDTCFGPLYDMEVIYTEMEQQKIDFWGITDHGAVNSGMPETNGPLPAHIQSYFMCFNNRVVQAAIFKEFWKRVNHKKNVYAVIRKYETYLTGLLTKHGFICKSFIEASNKDNISVFSPDYCINNKSPFVKIKSFLYYPYPKHILKLLEDKTNYPVSLIKEHFIESYDPSITFILNDIAFPLESFSNKEFLTPLPKIAVHLHVFYLDVFEKYVDIFDNWTIKYHLYITTDTPDKKQKITDYLQNHPSYNNLKEIIVFENHGRDILPWLRIAEKINNYDIVGHFHTKKAPTVNSYIGLSWQKEIFDLLLIPVDAILNNFSANNKVGIIIPDIPRYFQFDPVISDKEKETKELMNDLWKNMECKKEMDFLTLTTLIFPYGNMFWYRPSALKPLFDLKPENIDIPKEPLPITCVLHGLERLLVYTAWSEGFDFRIITYTERRASAFYSNMIINRYLDEIKSTKDYKLGNLLLKIPRFIKRILYRIIYDT